MSELDEVIVSEARAVLFTPCGLNTITRILSKIPYDVCTFHPDPHVAAFNEGRRSAATDIMNLLLSAEPNIEPMLRANAKLLQDSAVKLEYNHV